MKREIVYGYIDIIIITFIVLTQNEVATLRYIAIILFKKTRRREDYDVHKLWQQILMIVICVCKKMMWKCNTKGGSVLFF